MGGQLSDWSVMNYLHPEIVVSTIGKNDFETLYNENFIANFNTNKNVHAWCERRNVPDYITGVNEHNIVIEIDNNGYQFISNSREFIVNE